MGYIKNADLTYADVLRLVARLGYEDITNQVQGNYVLVVRTSACEIAGFLDLASARRFLQADIAYARSQGLLLGGADRA